MYTVDDHDEVVISTIAPPHEAGAPMPKLVATDNDLVLCYYTRDSDNVAVVPFVHPVAHYFGFPNDEALSGHPLASKGLKSYGIYEVKHSSWVRSLSRMNEVHPRHDPLRFEKLHHYIFTFHDTLFECVVRAVGEIKILPDGQALYELLKNKHSL